MDEYGTVSPSQMEAAAYTTSTAFEVQWFHLAFDCVVY